MAVIFGPGLAKPLPEGAVAKDKTVGDVNPITLQQIGSESVLQVLSSTGVLLSTIDSAGAWTGPIGTGALAGVVILAPAAAGRNTIRPGLDTVEALTLKRHSATQSAAHLQWMDDTGAVQGKIDPVNGFPQIGPDQSGGSSQAWICGGNDTGTLLSCQINPATTTAGNGDVALEVLDRNGRTIMSIGDSGAGGSATFFTQAVGDFGLFVQSIAGQTHDFVGIFDHDHGYVLRAGPGKIGFLGAPSVVRQTNGTAAQLAAITDANAKAFLTAISNGLVNLGLFAAPV
jgi:hypothetical protein